MGRGCKRPLLALRYQIDKLCHLLKIDGKELVEITVSQRGGRSLIALGLYDKPSQRTLPSSRTPMGTDAETLLGITFGYDETGELIVRSGVPGTYDHRRALVMMAGGTRPLTFHRFVRRLAVQAPAADRTFPIKNKGETRDLKTRVFESAF